jgi:hypothetical protein
MEAQRRARTLCMNDGEGKFTWSQPQKNTDQGRGKFVAAWTVGMHFAVTDQGIERDSDGTGLCFTFEEFEEIYKPVMQRLYETLRSDYPDIREVALFVINAASACALALITRRQLRAGFF